MNEFTQNSDLSHRSIINPDIITRTPKQEHFNPDQVREEIENFCFSLRRLFITPLLPGTVQQVILEGPPKIIKKIPGSSVGCHDDILISRKGIWNPKKHAVTIYDDLNWRESLYEELGHAQWSQRKKFPFQQSTTILEAYAEWLKVVALAKGDNQRIKLHFIEKHVGLNLDSGKHLLFHDILTHDYSIIGKPPDAALLQYIFIRYGYFGVLNVTDVGVKTLPKRLSWSEFLYALRTGQNGLEEILKEHYNNFESQFNTLFSDRINLRQLTKLAQQYYAS